MHLYAPLTAAAIVVAVLGQSGQLQAADNVYKWVDENGLTHYTALPPKNRSASKIRTKTGHSDPVSYKSPESDIRDKPATDTEQTTASTPVSLKDPNRCAIARENLETLRVHARVRIKSEDGEMRYLKPEEHNQKKVEAQKAIRESC